jgi:hypothetical protein
MKDSQLDDDSDAKLTSKFAQLDNYSDAELAAKFAPCDMTTRAGGG